MYLAEKIQILRKQTKLSQEELAERVGVSRQAVSKWESEQCVPEIDKVIQLSDVFGVTTDYLLKDEGDPQECTALVNAEGMFAQHCNIAVTVLFWFSSGLIIFGLLSCIVINYVTTPDIVYGISFGIFAQVLGCVIFEVFRKYVVKQGSMKRIRERFYVMNAFFLLLGPTYLLTWVCSMLMPFINGIVAWLLWIAVYSLLTFSGAYLYIREGKRMKLNHQLPSLSKEPMT